MNALPPPGSPLPPPPPPPPPGAISMRSVSRWYGDVVAVNDITYEFQPGVTGLLGPNGAGKSTVLHMMSGMLRPSAGELFVRGESAWRQPTMFRQVGLVPERESVYPFLTAWEYAVASATLHGLDDPERSAREAIDMVELGDAMHRKMGGYSKGMRQRAKIAAALVHDPEVLVLDEPFNGTDPRQRLQLTDMLQRLGAAGRTIVFSSHILEDVEGLADVVAVIIGGRLAASGDFRKIRRLMTDRPHSFTIRSSDNRAIAAALVSRPDVAGITFDDSARGGAMVIQTSDFGDFTEAIAPIIVSTGVELHELRPADDSLENVFSYLVNG